LLLFWLFPGPPPPFHRGPPPPPPLGACRAMIDDNARVLNYQLGECVRRWLGVQVGVGWVHGWSESGRSRGGGPSARTGRGGEGGAHGGRCISDLATRRQLNHSL
jgi:hypothetical protein